MHNGQRECKPRSLAPGPGLDEIARDGSRHDMAIDATRLGTPAMFRGDRGERPLGLRHQQPVVAIRLRVCVQAQPKPVIVVVET